MSGLPLPARQPVYRGPAFAPCIGRKQGVAASVGSLFHLIASYRHASVTTAWISGESQNSSLESGLVVGNHRQLGTIARRWRRSRLRRCRAHQNGTKTFGI